MSSELLHRRRLMMQQAREIPFTFVKCIVARSQANFIYNTFKISDFDILEFTVTVNQYHIRFGANSIPRVGCDLNGSYNYRIWYASSLINTSQSYIGDNVLSEILFDIPNKKTIINSIEYDANFQSSDNAIALAAPKTGAFVGYKNGVKVCDLRAAYANTSGIDFAGNPYNAGKCGLYDVVNDIFYTKGNDSSIYDFTYED